VTSEEEDKWYLRRLDNGLFTLQNVDYVLAWIAMEDDGVSIMPPCTIQFTNARVILDRFEHIW
jgi:hypothetical protein